MRFASLSRDGQQMLAVRHGNEYLDLAMLAPGMPATMLALLQAGAEILPRLREALRTAEPAAVAAARTPVEQARYLPLLPQPGKLFCLGLNFADHAAEGGFELPKYPPVFLRTATSLCAHEEPMLLPSCSDKLDYEAELAVVIGRRVKHLREDDALDAVFGYSLFNDGSVRNFQKHSPTWTVGKNFDATGPFGPELVTADELPPGAHGLRIACRVNGRTLQDSSTDQMLSGVAKTLAYLTRGITLEPGDVVMMGTPAGVGFARKPPIWLRDGDVCEVEIEGIGVLRNPVRAEAPDAT